MTLGSLVVALPRLYLLLGIGAAWIVAHLIARRSDTRTTEGPLWWSLLIGLIVARATYVFTHLADFRIHPWQALAFWHDGYSRAAGAAAIVVSAVYFAVRRRSPMRQLLVPVLVGLVVWSGVTGMAQALRQATDRPLPDLAVEDLNGGRITLDSFGGQPVVLNLWATWCPPCRREMPTLAAAQQANPEVMFLLVNSGESAVTVRQYLAGEQLHVRNVLLDSRGDIGRHFDARALPTTLFFDIDGKLRHTHVGELSRARLGDYLRPLRAAAPR